MNFTKPALTVSQQVVKLQGRGLAFEDAAEAEHYLRYVGYYRLSAYTLPLQQGGVHDKPFMRNLCAHHARLWNRQTVIKINIAKKHQLFLKVNDRFYAFAVIIHDLMQRITPHTGWHERLAQLLAAHLFVNPLAMSFSVTWNSEPFWKILPEDYSI